MITTRCYHGNTLGCGKIAYPWCMEVAQLLREARERAHLTQREVAEHLGLSTPAWTQIERGRRGLAARHIEKVVEVLDLDDAERQTLRLAAARPGVTLRDIDRKLDEVLRRLDGCP